MCVYVLLDFICVFKNISLHHVFILVHFNNTAVHITFQCYLINMKLISLYYRFCCYFVPSKTKFNNKK